MSTINIKFKNNPECSKMSTISVLSTSSEICLFFNFSRKQDLIITPIVCRNMWLLLSQFWRFTMSMYLNYCPRWWMPTKTEIVINHPSMILERAFSFTEVYLKISPLSYGLIECGRLTNFMAYYHPFLHNYSPGG